MQQTRFALVVLVLALAGCGGAEDGKGAGAGRAGAAAGGEEPAGSTEGGPGADDGKPSAIEVLGISGPEEKAWSAMSFDEREFYMIGKVLPISKELFQQFDTGTYAEFDCDTCHGENGEANDFAMPTEELPVVPPADSSGYEIMKEGKPEMVRFMEEEVTPTTHTLLGVDEFGCNDCHPSS